jgi:predicted nucleotidyltransferase
MGITWLDFATPHKHLVVDVTITRARTNCDVPTVGGSVPTFGSVAMGAQQAQVDVDLRTSFSLGTPSI